MRSLQLAGRDDDSTLISHEVELDARSDPQRLLAEISNFLWAVGVGSYGASGGTVGAWFADTTEITGVIFEIVKNAANHEGIAKHMPLFRRGFHICHDSRLVGVWPR